MRGRMYDWVCPISFVARVAKRQDDKYESTNCIERNLTLSDGAAVCGMQRLAHCGDKGVCVGGFRSSMCGVREARHVFS